MRNSIFLRRKMKVVLQNGTSLLPEVYLATAMKNIESFGFTFSRALIDTARTLSVDEFVHFYTLLIQDLKKLKGAHVLFSPMYPNFPEQVMEASDSELYINAIIHYISAFLSDTTGDSLPKEGLPTYIKEERFPLIDEFSLTTIELGTEEEFNQLLTQLIGAKTSISLTDREDIDWAISTSSSVAHLFPGEIPMKENLAFFVATLLKYNQIDIEQLTPYFKTATDVLRLAVALSEGDVSLATPTRFKKFTKMERRFFLTLLEGITSPTEDMLRYKEMWKRLGEVLHPGDYKRFKQVNAAFDVLRNDESFETFNGKVEAALLRKDTATAANLLSKRPGEFARRLDHLLRLNEHQEDVLALFGKTAVSVSTPVLLQVYTHFKHRNEEKDFRIIFPKGSVSNVVAIENNLPSLEEQVCSSVVAITEETLIERFSELEPLGKVVLDKALAEYIVPFSQRSASKALRTLVRGSRVEMPAGDTLRFFLWWKEGVVNGTQTGRVDIDLSGVLYDEKWGYLEHISYTNLRSSKYKAAHSGDITSAPKGACEFIDLDIPSMIKYGARYAVMNVFSFTQHPFCDLPECFAGWMMREHPSSGEIFEPTTVVDKFDIASDTVICIPVLFDLLERKVIWSDLSLKQHPGFANNVENNRGSLGLMGKAMTSLVKPNLYDLFFLHANARGELVEREDLTEGEMPDTVFSVSEGITPTDIELIMAEYL